MKCADALHLPEVKSRASVPRIPGDAPYRGARRTCSGFPDRLPYLVGYTSPRERGGIKLSPVLTGLAGAGSSRAAG